MSEVKKFIITKKIKQHETVKKESKQESNQEPKQKHIPKTKQKLGQFYTTNYSYILQGLTIPENIQTIIEPFAGNGDLLEFIKKQTHIKQPTLECYDIDPKQDYIIKRDTISNPPDYKNKYLLTNPPYLARNKSDEKALFDKYDVNDLYKCLIKELTIQKECLGGIIIIPLNFWSSIRFGDIELRKAFLAVYSITRLNVFEEQVFDDTTYTTCAFQFIPKTDPTKPNNLNIFIYPANINITAILNDDNDYLVGGDIYNLKTKNKYKITRATTLNQEKLNTNILVKCIDDNKDNQIGLSIVAPEARYIDNTPNQSSRTYATLIIIPAIDENKQKQLVEKFNSYLETHRKKYHSLFLTNYRESKDIARKRISFDLVYRIVEYILDNTN